MIIGLWLALPGTGAAAADKPQNPAAVIGRLFSSPGDAASLLAPNLSDTAAAGRLADLARRLGDKLGAVEGVDYVNWKYRIRFAKALVFVNADFDQQLRLTGLRIVQQAPRLQSLDEGKKLVAGLGDQTSLLIEKDGKDVVAVNADAPLAVGSAFKLSYVNALADAVHAGRLSWSQTVPLQTKWAALPTGILQDWPADASMTIEALAGLMVSLSDNTATDAVMDLVGREDIQKYAFGNDPILTPREYMVLSDDAEGPLRQRFLAAPPSERASILQSIKTAPLPESGAVGVVTPSPLEWRYSLRQLCGLIDRVHRLPIMQINPGLAARSDWQAIAFKGGSDHGVFNLTQHLGAKSGPSYCLSVTINTPHDLNETQVVAVLTGLVFFLHDKAP